MAQELQGVVTAHTSPPPVGVRRLVREMPLAKSSTRYEAAKRLLKAWASSCKSSGHSSESGDGLCRRSGDTEIRAAHRAAMVSAIPYDLDSYVRGALWCIKLLRLGVEGLAPIAVLPNPALGSWVSMVFYPGDNVEEVLEACQHRIAFKWTGDLSSQESRTERRTVSQLMFGPNEQDMLNKLPRRQHPNGFPY